MNKDMKSVLIAVCLGDGSLTNQKSVLAVEHSINQLKFLEWKKNLLEVILNKKINTRFRERFDTRTNNVYKQCSFHVGNKYFRIIRKWLYKPTKTYSRIILDKLTPLGIAIWYMDDGGCKFRISKRTGKVSSIQLSLYTYCTLEEAKTIQKYFKEVWDIYFKIYKHRNDKYLLCANTENGNKFIELVRPHIIPSMFYKIDVNFTSAKPLFKGEDIV